MVYFNSLMVWSLPLVREFISLLLLSYPTHLRFELFLLLKHRNVAVGHRGLLGFLMKGFDFGFQNLEHSLDRVGGGRDDVLDVILAHLKVHLLEHFH